MKYLIAAMCLIVTMTGITISAKTNKYDTLYVFSKKAFLYESPSVTSNRVLMVSQGDPLIVIKSQPHWKYVKTAKKKGWISQYVTSKDKPITVQTRLQQSKFDEKKAVRKRISSFSSGAVTRGFTADSDKKEGVKVDENAVIIMESTKPKSEDVSEFIDDGNLGDTP